MSTCTRAPALEALIREVAEPLAEGAVSIGATLELNRADAKKLGEDEGIQVLFVEDLTPNDPIVLSFKARGLELLAGWSVHRVEVLHSVLCGPVASPLYFVALSECGPIVSVERAIALSKEARR
jgi:hypothetical protein